MNEQEIKDLKNDIKNQIKVTENRIGTSWATEVSDASNRIAISNLYIALSNLVNIK